MNFNSDLFSAVKNQLDEVRAKVYPKNDGELKIFDEYDPDDNIQIISFPESQTEDTDIINIIPVPPPDESSCSTLASENDWGYHRESFQESFLHYYDTIVFLMILSMAFHLYLSRPRLFFSIIPPSVILFTLYSFKINAWSLAFIASQLLIMFFKLYRNNSNTSNSDPPNTCSIKNGSSCSNVSNSGSEIDNSSSIIKIDSKSKSNDSFQNEKDNRLVVNSNASALIVTAPELIEVENKLYSLSHGRSEPPPVSAITSFVNNVADFNIRQKRVQIYSKVDDLRSKFHKEKEQMNQLVSKVEGTALKSVGFFAADFNKLDVVQAKFKDICVYNRDMGDDLTIQRSWINHWMDLHMFSEIHKKVQSLINLEILPMYSFTRAGDSIDIVIPENRHDRDRVPNLFVSYVLIVLQYFNEVDAIIDEFIKRGIGVTAEFRGSPFIDDLLHLTFGFDRALGPVRVDMKQVGALLNGDDEDLMAFKVIKPTYMALRDSYENVTFVRNEFYKMKKEALRSINDYKDRVRRDADRERESLINFRSGGFVKEENNVLKVVETNLFEYKTMSLELNDLKRQLCGLEKEWLCRWFDISRCILLILSGVLVQWIFCERIDNFFNNVSELLAKIFNHIFNLLEASHNNRETFSYQQGRLFSLYSSQIECITIRYKGIDRLSHVPQLFLDEGILEGSMFGLPEDTVMKPNAAGINVRLADAWSSVSNGLSNMFPDVSILGKLQSLTDMLPSGDWIQNIKIMFCFTWYLLVRLGIMFWGPPIIANFIILKVTLGNIDIYSIVDKAVVSPVKIQIYKMFDFVEKSTGLPLKKLLMSYLFYWLFSDIVYEIWVVVKFPLLLIEFEVFISSEIATKAILGNAEDSNEKRIPRGQFALFIVVYCLIFLIAVVFLAEMNRLKEFVEPVAMHWCSLVGDQHKLTHVSYYITFMSGISDAFMRELNRLMSKLSPH